MFGKQAADQPEQQWGQLFRPECLASVPVSTRHRARDKVSQQCARYSLSSKTDCLFLKNNHASNSIFDRFTKDSRNL